ncbi:RNA polymerase sigma factor [Acanthopleuribacter pedis]|uniref:Sigma-70 family RNA polymerase sigma factor n=1 Tax=Acanthopleuribacter pedis TaxID=442870 RepID=A0A8J7U7I5_9BACT|nr:sigma-70 family RNA polymerase sigma factor [Acanthopleuribacter pedis]MBO1323039.1 sigma-70 family RNA polymerase sigma factor [Acanthopleuribacter pedis]
MNQPDDPTNDQQAAFAQQVAQYHKLVFSLINRYYSGRLRDHAEDLSQEIWAKLWVHFKKNENNVVNFKSYLYRTVQTTLWDAVRSLDQEADQEELEELADHAQERADQDAFKRMQLDNLLAQLKTEERQMIQAYLKGFSNQEISVLMGTSEGRVRNLISRTKKKLAVLGGR